MKKFMAILLVLAMASMLGISALATDPIDPITSLPADDVDIDVAGTYSSGGTTGDIYRVDVEWGSLTFAYKTAVMKWDPAEHKYVVDTSAAWTFEPDSNTITVTNHSNVDVDVDFAFLGVGDVTGELTVDTDELDSAATGDALGDFDKADFVTTALTIKDTSVISAGGTIGTVTVTIE